VLDEIESNPGVTGDRAFDTFAVTLHESADPEFVDAIAEGRALGLWPLLEEELGQT
jgi:hypothetical protein